MKKLFIDIEKLYTLKPAAVKQGRNVQEKDLGLITDAAILTEKGRILWVGKKSQAKKFGRVQRESLNAKVVLPALVDCHTHMVFAGNRKDEFELRNQGVSYQEIADNGGGILSTVKATRKATAAELLELAQEREKNYLKQGVATVEIKSGYGLNLRTEKKMLEVARSLKKLRVVTTFLGPHALPPEFKNTSEYIDETRKWLPMFKVLADRVDIFIEQGYFSQQEAKRFLDDAQSQGFDICAHTDQLNATGSSLFAAQLGAKSVDHCIRITDEEVLELAKRPTTAVLLPTSDFYIRVPYPPARRLIDAGVAVALATDFNPGSAPSQDINFTAILARLEMKMSLPETIVGLTLNASRALGLESEIGSVEVGKSADFVCFSDELGSLFYEVGYHPVQSLWKQSKRLFKNKK